jgi:hypothetical protein
VKATVKAKVVAVILALGVAISADPRPAYAYLDPGTASILLQSLIGGVMAGGVVIRLYYRRIKTWVVSCFRGKSKPRPQ